MKQLAQINIARLRHPEGDPRVAEFFDNLDRVNAAAERMPGFVWRLKDDSGNAMSISADDDPSIILNMSVWEMVETFEKFVWQTVHATVYRRRTGWFEPMDTPHSLCGGLKLALTRPRPRAGRVWNICSEMVRAITLSAGKACRQHNSGARRVAARLCLIAPVAGLARTVAVRPLF